MEIFEFENKSYLISFLLLTRKNPEGIKKVINNFTSLSDKQLDNFELIIKIDYDDEESINLIKEFSNQNTNLKFLVSSRLKGYPSMNEFSRDIAYLARGKYLMHISDDTEMVTPNWNRILENELKETRFYACNFNFVSSKGESVNIKDAEEPKWAEDRTFLGKVGVNFHDFIYIAYPKKIMELWGFVAPHALVDNFIGDIGKRVSFHPWNTPVYEFIDSIEINHYGGFPEDSESFHTSELSEKVHNTYRSYINDALFFDCANKVKEYIEWEKWHKQHKLNIVNDFRNSGLSVKDYFDLK
jgi:hypothetical protein